MKNRRKAPKRGRAKIKKGLRARKVPSQDKIEGTLKVHKEGFGFLLPEDPSIPDIFIPPRRMAGAMDGDKVRVTLWSDPERGKQEGSVEEILERGKHWLVGVLNKSGNTFFVETEIGRPPLRFEVDREDLRGARLGETIGIEVVEYPSGRSPGSGRVIQLFGARGDEKTEIDIVILKHQLPREFPKEVLKEAKEISKNRMLKPNRGRKDLRQLPLVTIDGENARDFDDAICVKRDKKGYRLWVSIADVSHYVRPGTALDQEAFQRGTSCYFPEKVIPMLPEELSNDLCSLRPQEDRYSFTAELSFNSQGVLQETLFYKSLIRSKSRLTYNQVARALLKKDTKVRTKIARSLPMLEEAFDLFRILRKRRLARGSIDFDLPEPEIVMDIEEGDIEAIIKAERNEAHMLIEEFMVAANEAVATFITEQHRPSLYRVHARPDPEKVKAFQTLLHNLGFKTQIPEEPRPKDMARVLEVAKGHAEERLLQHLMLRSMKQAVYGPKNEGHFGLASSCYTHFTSPIRRYPDLVVHRILTEVLSGRKLSTRQRKSEIARLGPIAGHASRRERTAMEAEWEALDLKVALFMQKYVGEGFSGVVSRIAKFGFFVELKKFFVQGLVLLEDLTDDFYVFEEKNYRLRGRRKKRIFKIGTEVKVQVSKVDIEERRVYFILE